MFVVKLLIDRVLLYVDFLNMCLATLESGGGNFENKNIGPMCLREELGK